MTARFAFYLLVLLLPWAAGAQVPFTCEGQGFAVQQGTNELAVMSIDPGNSSLKFTPIDTLQDLEIEALGFRSTDRLLYGIGKTSHRLYRIDANGSVEDLGLLATESGLAIIGGEVTPDGRYFAAIGIGPGAQFLIKVDLESPDLAVSTLPLPASRRIIDIAFNPMNGNLYGYDEIGRSFVSINFSSGSTTALSSLQDGDEGMGLFFNAYGELFAYGSTVFGVSSAWFSINQSSGQLARTYTGSPYPVTDITACPYTVDIQNIVRPTATFPCSEIRFTYTIGNGSGQVQSGVSFEHLLPAGFQLAGIDRNPFGGTLDQGGPENRIRIDNMSIPRWVDSLVVRVEVGDVPGASFRSQAMLGNLPPAMGGSRRSDNAATPAPDDSTAIQVNRFEADSLRFSNFLCLGSSLTLDASDYGDNVLWNNGSTDTEISVSQAGTYSLQAFSGCQALSVTYDVTVASCPYTIALGQKILPNETFPCKEVIFRYIIDNDSGLPRSGAALTDTLPEGFTAVRLERNPFGGALQAGPAAEVLHIRNMALPPGIDSIDVIVEVGNVPSGTYRHRAILSGLPPALGPTRLSFNADTLGKDSTALHVFGVESDSTYIEAVLCPNETLVLDGSPYGASFLWEDGSTGARLPATRAGRYRLSVFNGCEPSLVFFDVSGGPLIDATFPQDTIEIHLGEEFTLSPTLTNQGNTLLLEWDGPEASLSCLDCPSPSAKPLDDARYTFRAANELCADTLYFTFLVDKSRRIYAPNAFSPNRDGRNDYFYLQSPDFGIIRSLSVYSRWGGQVFQFSESILNQPPTGWDGMYKGRPAPEGTYLWKAEIEFIGGIVEVFSGEVALVR